MSEASPVTTGRSERVRNDSILAVNAKSEEVLESMVKYDHREIFSIIETEGYSEFFETMVCKAIVGRNGGILSLLIKLRDIIPEKFLFSFADNCVAQYILSESEYGFSYTGIGDILELYRDYFSENIWIDILEGIISRLSRNEIDGVYHAGTDIGTYALNYLMRFKPECVEDAFEVMCNTHKSFISANGFLMYRTYELDVNNDVTTLQEMVEFHLGCGNCL